MSQFLSLLHADEVPIYVEVPETIYSKWEYRNSSGRGILQERLRSVSFLG